MKPLDRNVQDYLDKYYHRIDDYYYWRWYKNFNLFLYSEGTWTVILHERSITYQPVRPDWEFPIKLRFKYWNNLNYNDFIKFIAEIEKMDKEMSLDAKIDEINKDFV